MTRVYEVVSLSEPGEQLALVNVDGDNVTVVQCSDEAVQGVLDAPTRVVTRSRLASLKDGIGISVGMKVAKLGEPGYFDVLVRALAAAGFTMNETVPMPVEKSLKGSTRPVHKYARREPDPEHPGKYIYIYGNGPEPRQKAHAIEDFGVKIGGAKKDQWRDRGLELADATSMTPSERDIHITKKNVFPTPDYNEFIAAGMPLTVAWACKKVKDSLGTEPYIPHAMKELPDGTQQAQLRYVAVLTALKEGLPKVRSYAELEALRDAVFPLLSENTYERRKKLTPAAEQDLLIAAGMNSYRKVWSEFSNPGQWSLGYLEQKLQKKGWPETQTQEAWQRQFVIHKSDIGSRVYDKSRGGSITLTAPEWFVTARAAAKSHAILSHHATEEAAIEWAKANVAKGGLKLQRPLVENVVRTGPDYRGGKDVTGQQILDTFGFRGGEFGNWTNEEDRKQSLNQAYDGLMDLANLLGLPPKAISLDGELGIAFGARGSGSAAAHYEPGRVVINLTRTRGAGSLAHELAHAFDDSFSKRLGGGKAGAYVSGRGFTKSDVPVLAAWANVMSAIEKRPKTKEEVVAEYQKEIDRTRENIRGWMSRMNVAAKGTAWEASVADATGILRYAPDEVKNAELKAALVGKTISRDNVEAVLRGIAKKLNQSRDDIKGAMSNATWLWSRMGWMDELKAGKEPVGTTHTDFYKVAEKLGDYWVRPHELFARAFENWVARTLTTKNQQSDYLVAYAKGDDDTPWSAIYPKGAEAEAIGTQMVGLVSAIRDFVLQKTVEKSMGGRAMKALRKAIRGTMKPGHKYVRREPQAEGYKYVYQEPPKVSVPGTPVSIIGADKFSFSLRPNPNPRNNEEKFVVVENTTGVPVARGDTPERTIAQANHNVGQYSVEGFAAVLDAHYAMVNIAPEYAGRVHTTFKPGDAVKTMRPGLFGMPYSLAGTVFASKGALRVRINPNQPVGGAKTLDIVGWWKADTDFTGPKMNSEPAPKSAVEVAADAIHNTWEEQKQARLAQGTWGVLPSETQIGDILESANDGKRYVVSEITKYGLSTKSEDEYMIGGGGGGIGGADNVRIEDHRKVGHFDEAVAKQRTIAWMRANIDDATQWVQNNPELPELKPLLAAALAGN